MSLKDHSNYEECLIPFFFCGTRRQALSAIPCTCICEGHGELELYTTFQASPLKNMKSAAVNLCMCRQQTLLAYVLVTSLDP